MFEFGLILLAGFFGGIVDHFVRDWETMNWKNFVESVVVGGLAAVGVIYLLLSSVSLVLPLALTVSMFSGYLGTQIIDGIIEEFYEKFLYS